MSSISSLTKAMSGLSAAQKGLQVTAHNISNTNTEGYTRQQLLQSDSGYLKIGTNGSTNLKVGTGVSCDEIRQIRDDLADKRLRKENSVLCYYQKLNAATTDIESIFDEPYGNTVSDLLNTFWSQTQKLSTTPDGVEERMSFISSAKVLIGKINTISESLTTYQSKLNNDVKSSVKRINEILEEIKECNTKIAQEEAAGQNANDYRDQRNLLLDELSQYGEVSYYEESDHRMLVKFEGHIVVNKDLVTKMELQSAQSIKETDSSAVMPFEVPVWSDSKSEVFDLSEKSSSTSGNDAGSLKALLIARGERIVTSETTWDEVALNDNYSVDTEGNAFIIPKVQKMLNDFTDKLVDMVNSSFNGTGIGSHEGLDGVPVFIEVNGKYEVNPELLENGGYNKLGTVAKAEDGSDNSANTGDNSLIKKFLSEFGKSQSWYKDSEGSSAPYEKSSTITDFFSELITDLGTQGSLYTAKASEKNISVTNIENERLAISGVSTDEEFSNMLKYQYAYNASARMITMLDSMLDTIINKI